VTDTRRIAGVLADFARGAGLRLTFLAGATSLAAGAAAVSVSLWLKLILDSVVAGDLTGATALAAGLATTVIVQASASRICAFVSSVCFNGPPSVSSRPSLPNALANA
jgi:hypothetical protein